ncbi:Cytochrome P450 monooxygenase 169 [Psilocybe cubensis]|uniref:Cytochrome P450 monooxygenase 169 n=2 Tax=Psilocybe cubensis TaxID=181762 RepID=A0ACB8HG14_PSICU|nr:Cytochrome P450 monooxygenase 169 [Psilocybe cubensis]KAH9486647.1 Cytochrome P450 monooxygenase 169 [Psilocybe cubensis]
MIHLLFHKLSLVLSGFTLVILVHYFIHLLASRRAFGHVPGPSSSSFLWGEEWELYHQPPGAPYVDWHRRFGKLVAFTGAFGHQVLSVTDMRAISFILGEAAYSFPKPQGVRAWFKATLGEGILWVEGKKEHETQRRILAPALNLQSVRQLTDTFFETSARLSSQWSKLLEGSRGNESEIEVTNWAGRFALDTIGRAAFSYDFDCLSGEPHDLADALDGLTNNEHKSSSFYMRALFWLVPSILFIGKKGEMIRKVKRELGLIASKMWKDAKHTGEANNRTVMANMLRFNNSTVIHMDEEEIVSQMRTVMSAGYETVSAVVAWMLYEIACHPDFQNELRDEICAIPDHSFDHLINELPLLDAALKETLRLHPAILENHHEASETVIMPLSEGLAETGEHFLVIPKGTLVVIPVNVLQIDNSVWGEDATAFRPKRWLDKKISSTLKGQELLAFSAGPRSCIGKTFAMTEIKALIVTLLPRFSFRCRVEIEPFQSFVIRPRVVGETASSLPLLVKKL